MYTSKNATREFALKAASAAERAMEHHVCCKSQYKFKCFSCGEMINRGDKITKCTTAVHDGMTLRYRGGDASAGLTWKETAFYLGQSGTRSWVHIGCNPVFWERREGFASCLANVYTDWGVKMSYEFEEWRQRTNHYDVEEFMEIHGYPQEKWMKNRIIQNVTRFQAIWRGYLYKQAYPFALRAAKATEAINLNARATLSSQEVQRPERSERNEFLYQNSIGAHVEILFNENHPSVAVYSGEVTKIQGLPEIDGLYFWVKYHHDHEMRRYHWRKLKHLKLQCEKFKSKHGIEAQITGRLPLYKFFYP